MIWGITIGIIVAGFLGLFTMVATFSMANIWVSVLVGAVVGGIVGKVWEVARSASQKKKAAA